MILGKQTFCYSNVDRSIEVGNYSSIASDVIFHEVGDNHLCVKNKKCVFTTNYDQPTETKEIKIGNDVWIARGAKILSGVQIGDGAIIGAWSVVTKDVPPYAVVVGNTGRIVRYRFTKSQIKKLQKLKWWDWDHKLVEERLEDMKNINSFLKKYD